MSECTDDNSFWYLAGITTAGVSDLISMHLRELRDGRLPPEDIRELAEGTQRVIDSITGGRARETWPDAVSRGIARLTGMQKEILAHLSPDSRTFFMIKPQFVEYKDAIVQMLCSTGKVVSLGDVPKVPAELIKLHYVEHMEKDFFQWNVDYFTGKHIVVGVLEGENVIYRTRRIVGSADPAIALPESIRGVGYEFWGAESLAETRKAGRALDNVVHASSGLEDARREIKLWGEYLQARA